MLQQRQQEQEERLAKVSVHIKLELALSSLKISFLLVQWHKDIQHMSKSMSCQQPSHTHL